MPHLIACQALCKPDVLEIVAYFLGPEGVMSNSMAPCRALVNAVRAW